MVTNKNNPMNPYSLTIRNGSTSSPVVFGQNFDRPETANRIPPLSGHYRETSTLRVFFSGNDAAIFKTDKESPGRRFTHPLPSPQTHSTTFRWCSCENGPILAFLLAYFASISIPIFKGRIWNNIWKNTG